MNILTISGITFMDFMASCASSMEFIGSHSVVCGRTSWLIISISSSDVRKEVSVGISEHSQLKVRFPDLVIANHSTPSHSTPHMQVVDSTC